MVLLYNTVVAGNTVGTMGIPSDIFGSLSATSANNLIASAATSGGLTDGTNQNIIGNNGVGTIPFASLLDPELVTTGEPSYYVLPIPTHNVVSGSSLIDAGNSLYAIDDEGEPLSRLAGFEIDIGAVEYVGMRTYIVDTLIDEMDEDYSPGDFSLREAIEIAEGTAAKDLILFSPALAGGTLALTLNQIIISEDLTIEAPPERITIDGQNLSRHFLILSAEVDLRNFNLIRGNGEDRPGSFGSFRGGSISVNDHLHRYLVTIENSTFANNSALLGSGAIEGDQLLLRNVTVENNRTLKQGPGAVSALSLTVESSTIRANSSFGSYGALSGFVQTVIRDSSIVDNNGVGISATGDSLVVANSLIARNEAGAVGAGISSRAATTFVINTTVSGNRSTTNGGGISASGDATITNSTITGNVANKNGTVVARGGGLYTTSPNTKLRNTIVAGNYRYVPTIPDEIFVGVSQQPGATLDVSQSDNNLIGDAGSAGGLANAQQGNIVGASVDAVLLPLADNGGSTETHALAPGSPAREAGANPWAIDETGAGLPFDQRGPGFNRFIGSRVDIGAFESQFALPSQDDLIVFDQLTGRWQVGINTGSSFQWIDGPRWNPDQMWEIGTGDVNGDGFVDGIGFTASNAIFVALNDGTGQLTTTFVGTFSQTESFDHVLFGDFDGNGTLDLLAQLSTGEWFSKRWNGTRFETAYFGRWSATGWADFRVGDFNGDGADDIIGIRDSGDGQRAFWIYGLSNPTPVGRRFTSQFAGSFGSGVAQSGWHNFLVGDFNGDGKDDILSQTGSGQFWYAVSNGTPITQPDLGASQLSLSAGANFPSTTFTNPFQIGDFNGDGLDDIATRLPNAGTFYDSHLWVGLTSYTTAARMSASKWGERGRTLTWGPEVVGDFNRDGIDDLASFDLGRQLTFVAISSGSAFGTTLGFGPIVGANRLVDPEADSGGLG
ncbi:MAG: VCBS repeat-containing protein [Planctomycetaceae bacterium]|nr:VCBS repeat-containing protein [Planctomycetaceae bacterium]